VTDKKLGAVSGVATLRVLAGTLGVADFTVNSLAQRTGVSRETVDTVLRRHPEAFRKIDRLPGPGRGRPQVRWQLRPDAIDEVVREVERLQAGAGVDRLSSTGSLEPSLIDASLTMAADSILRASADEPTNAMPLVDSARSSLLAAGFDPALNEVTVQGGAEEHEIAPRARLISAVADLVEAEITGDHERIDLAKAKALPLVREARTSTFAEEWLPLAERVVNAEGSVLGGLVEVVDPGGQSLVQTLFPHLTRVAGSSIGFDPREHSGLLTSTDILADERVELAGTLSAILPAVIFHVIAGRATTAAISGLLRKTPRRPKAANIRPVPKRVVLAENLDSANIATIASSDAQLVVVGHDTYSMQRGLARVVNRTAVGLDTGRSEQILFIKH
jgi:hypothetical protein